MSVRLLLRRLKGLGQGRGLGRLYVLAISRLVWVDLRQNGQTCRVSTVEAVFGHGLTGVECCLV
jgi:hypothetical protein